MSDVSLALRPVLALDLGGTQLRTALVRADGTVALRRTEPTPRLARELVGAAVRALTDTRDAAARELGEVAAAIGISAPGPLDAKTGSFIDPPNLDPTTWNMPFASEIANGVGLPASVEKDTNVAALGEGFFGAAVAANDFVYITISTGIGGAVVSAGKLLHGPDGVAGELGHLTIDAFEGPLCGCGARGHLEAIASGTGIANAARAAGLTVGFASAADVAALEGQGDPTAAATMARARHAVAAALVTVVDLFNPDVVVVGGGIAAAEGERLLGPAREAVERTAFRVQARRARIVQPLLGDDVSLVGALILANAAIAVAADEYRFSPYGLQPVAIGPGQTALSNEPVYGDHRDAKEIPATDEESKRVVTIG